MFAGRNAQVVEQTKTRFTKFSAYDPDIQAFISALAKELTISKEVITNWVYSEGVIIFQKTKNTMAATHPVTEAKLTAHIPTVTSLGSRTEISLHTMMQACLQHFAKDPSLIVRLMDYLVVSTIADAVRHTESFRVIETRVARSYLEAIKVKPMSLHEIFSYNVSAFTQELNEIDDDKKLLTQLLDHIAYNREYSKHLAPPSNAYGLQQLRRDNI